MNITFTNHARGQMSRRGYKEKDILFVIQYGKRVRRTGVIFCQMRQNCLPKQLDPNDRRRKLVQTTVLLCSCGQTVITAYRSRKFRADIRKAKYDSKQQASICPNCQCQIAA